MLSPYRITWGELVRHLRATQLLARYASGIASQEQCEMLPLSQAVTQLEAVLLDASLPMEARAGNQKAFTALRSFLDGLSNPHGYPAASIRTVQFTVIDEAAQQHKLRCVLKTTGGDCSRLVQQTLGDLLQLCGLSPFVYFDGDQLNPTQPARRPQRKAAPRAAAQPPPTPAEVAAVRARAAAAGFPSQAITQEQFDELEAEQGARKEAKEAADEAVERLKEDLQKLDPLLKACAAVPWLPRDGDGRLRAEKIKSEVVDHLEALGWDIRGPLVRLWGGERSASTLCGGRLGGTKAAIEALLFHAKQLDKEYGKRVE